MSSEAFEKGLELITNQCRRGHHERSVVNSKLSIIDEVSRNELLPIRNFFFACLDFELKFFDEIIAISTVCSVFLRSDGQKLQVLSNKLAPSNLEIENNLQNFRNIDTKATLSKNASIEFSEIFKDFEANSLRKKALVEGIGKVASSFANFTEAAVRNKLNAGRMYKDVVETKAELLNAVKKYSKVCTCGETIETLKILQNEVLQIA